MFQAIEQIRIPYAKLCRDIKERFCEGEGFRRLMLECDKPENSSVLPEISQFSETQRGWLRELLSLKGKPIPENLIPTDFYLGHYRRCISAYEQATNRQSPPTNNQRGIIEAITEIGCLTDLLLHEVE